MKPNAKIDAFREYLHEEFSEWEIADADDFERMSWKFRTVKESIINVVYVQRSFWNNYSDTKSALQRLGLSQFMKNNEGNSILVRTDGIEVI